ncbi:Oligodendrocyte-myelin glycoprotein [Bagarius yarrelli]|uniref:Oligodendrocyte-myelin glycoprotein n=1 Tax=Bagarius yarrelli TaxID=175774 RepID=A0A556V6K6_BAGYA|nr:Oligodendrocyte-myelin glycoprotein [Bagarius yarrelli]
MGSNISRKIQILDSEEDTKEEQKPGEHENVSHVPSPPFCTLALVLLSSRLPAASILLSSRVLLSSPRSSDPVLSVARNHLCNVDNVLWRYSSLQELSLGHNQLVRFPRGLPASLESLQLQKNRITFITAGDLRNLGNLTRLDLEDNRIRAIQPGALLSLTRLRMLSLKGNQLSSLPSHLPSSLTHLDMSTNCISTLDLPSLAGLVNLQVFKVNRNCLHTVPEHAFDGLIHLRSVELADNLWVCECDIMYLYRWLLMDRLRMATNLVCAAPLHLAHKLLLTLSVVAICPKILMPKLKGSPHFSPKRAVKGTLKIVHLLVVVSSKVIVHNTCHEVD